jgi:hypothetical protein
MWKRREVRKNYSEGDARRIPRRTQRMLFFNFSPNGTSRSKMGAWHVTAGCQGYRLITPSGDDKELWKKLAVIRNSAAWSVDLF